MRFLALLILTFAPLILLIGCVPQTGQGTRIEKSNGSTGTSAWASASVHMFGGLTPADAQHMLFSDQPDQRRLAVATLSTQWEFGKHEPYLTYYRKLVHDDDFTVRAMAIRALNIARDHLSTSIFVDALKDDSEQVRLEAAKALVNLPDPAAVQPLERVLAGTRAIISPDGHQALVAESKDVRIAAADALRQYRTLDVARVLVSYLNETDFGVAWQSRQSLIALTGQDLQYDESAWLEYLVGPSKPFG
jgi:HEAT repeat protein